jgi:hypothetical protein
VFTTRRGLYGVRFEEVFPGQSRRIRTSSLRLQRQGEAVPFRVEPARSAFGPGSVLYFHADRTASSTDFTSEVAYELVLSPDGAAMGTVAGTPQEPVLVSSPMGSASFETNRFYQPGLLEAEDVWLWEAMTSSTSRTMGFTLSGVDGNSGQDGRVVVFLQGGSASGAAVDHHVRSAGYSKYPFTSRITWTLPDGWTARMATPVALSPTTALLPRVWAAE